MLWTNWRQGFLALVVLTAVAALFAIVGCGGGGDDETSTAASQIAASEGGEGNQGDAGKGGETSPGGKAASGGSVAEESEGGGSAGGESPIDETEEGGGAAVAGGATGGGATGGAKGGHGGSAGLQAGKAKKRPHKHRGSRQGPGGGTAGAPSPESFFADADAICEGRRKDTRERLPDFTKVGLDNLEKSAESIVSELVIPNLEGEMREIEALNPPSSVAAAVSALFQAIEGMISSGRDEPRNFILKGDAVASSEEVAKQNGFNVCGGI
jgi:hypothetical protein